MGTVHLVLRNMKCGTNKAAYKESAHVVGFARLLFLLGLHRSTMGFICRECGCGGSDTPEPFFGEGKQRLWFQERTRRLRNVDLPVDGHHSKPCLFRQGRVAWIVPGVERITRQPGRQPESGDAGAAADRNIEPRLCEGRICGRDDDNNGGAGHALHLGTE